MTTFAGAVEANGQYVEHLRVVRQIRDDALAKDELQLPQICVIGATSAGKSSFLSRLTGVPFPQDAEMCTKAAIVVNCTRRDDASSCTEAEPATACSSGSSKQANALKFYISDRNKKYVECGADEIAEKISERQNELLMDEFPHLAPDDVSSVKQIVSGEIKVLVEGPGVCDLTLVDLPGFVQNEGKSEGLKSQVEALVKKHVQKKETLICIVSEAKETEDNIEALQVAREFDKHGARTLHVLSKFDLFDSIDAERRARDWICEDWDNGNDLGRHAVINFVKGGEGPMEETREEEMLVGLNLPKERVGVIRFRERVQPLFANLIATHIPALATSIRLRLAECKRALEKIGREPQSDQELIMAVKTILLSGSTNVQQKLSTAAFAKFKEGAHAKEELLTFEWTTESFGTNAFECPVFQGREVFEDCLRRIRDEWRPILQEYMKDVKQIATTSTKKLLTCPTVTPLPGRLISAVITEAGKNVDVTSVRFNKSCTDALDLEAEFGTANSYFDASFGAMEAIPEALEKMISQSLTGKWNDLKNVDDVMQTIGAAKKEYAFKQSSAEMDENCKQKIHKAVKANFNCEAKTFVDSILKHTRNGVLHSRTSWIQNTLHNNPIIKSAAKEDPKIVKKREELKQQEERLTNCQLQIESVFYDGEAESSESQPHENAEAGNGQLHGALANGNEEEEEEQHDADAHEHEHEQPMEVEMVGGDHYVVDEQEQVECEDQDVDPKRQCRR
ncbi:unnamed protein product [Amoebophrya sp. A120]|nr:unnamed protein product [Amoebophrya sp. A120]|eukprot:GSA120T00003102001.1